MLTMPKRTTYRKWRKGRRVTTHATGHLSYGMYGRVSSDHARRTARQIEATRRTIRYCLARQGTLWVCAFPHRPVTGKPREVRMGGGAGSVKYWATNVRPGTVRFELSGVDARTAHLARSKGAKKLPFATVVTERPRPVLPAASRISGR